VPSVVECGEAARKKLAVDHAFGEPVGAAEAKPRGEFGEALAHQPLVARAEHREAVAHHHPIHARPVDQAPLPAGVAHHLGIMALTDHRECRRIDMAEHVEVDKAVVERRDQRVGHGMGKAREIAVGSRRVDHDKVVGILDRGDRLRKTRKFDRLVFVELERRPVRDAKMHRDCQAEARALGPGAPVVDVVREALLPGVEIDRRHPLADIHQRDGNVHRGGRFPRAALFIAKHDDVRGRGSPSSLHQHSATSLRRIPIRAWPMVKAPPSRTGLMIN